MRQHPVFYEMTLLKAKVGLWRSGFRLHDINDAANMMKDSLPTLIDTVVPSTVTFNEQTPVEGLLGSIIDGIRQFLNTDMGKQLIAWLEDLLKGLLTK